MIISKIELFNFRKFKTKGDEAGLSVSFHKGLNVLIGENDSGKTAIIDAMKLVLLTQSNEYIRPTDEDFFTDMCGNSTNEFQIKCIIEDFTQNEAKNFIEYLSFQNDQQETKYYMKLNYRAWKEKNRIYSELRVGDVADGVILDGKAKELLKAVYLKPLRDAEREMSSGRNSRLSQILLGHPLFLNQNEHKLKEIIANANQDIEKYFIEDEGRAVLKTIRDNLLEFNTANSSSNAQLKVADIQLKRILESLSLKVTEIKPGLGELNLLFIAAELLLLSLDNIGSLKLALIEELEAHLHPQAQLRLINYLQKEYNNSGTQIIISTHSTILSSKINLKNVILLKNGNGYDLGYGKTKLEKGDYLFLQRFLDSTKANLFFANGVIMVEGDAENILIPVISEIIDKQLEKYGVSMVNVHSIAFFRYWKIFVRSNGEGIGIPVSVVTDCDVKPEYDDDDYFDEKCEQSMKAIQEKENSHSIGDVRAFVAPKWTLEYCLALSCLKDEFHRAIYYAKNIKCSDKYTLTAKKFEEVEKRVKEDNEKWKTLSESEKAYNMYKLMLKKSGASELKAITAQCLAAILKLSILNLPNEKTKLDMFDLDLYQYEINITKKNDLKKRIEGDPYLKYIIEAIKYSTNKFDRENGE